MYAYRLRGYGRGYVRIPRGSIRLMMAQHENELGSLIIVTKSILQITRHAAASFFDLYRLSLRC